MKGYGYPKPDLQSVYSDCPALSPDSAFECVFCHTDHYANYISVFITNELENNKQIMNQFVHSFIRGVPLVLIVSKLIRGQLRKSITKYKKPRSWELPGEV
jgi:hypothetical protein